MPSFSSQKAPSLLPRLSTTTGVALQFQNKRRLFKKRRLLLSSLILIVVLLSCWTTNSFTTRTPAAALQCSKEEERPTASSAAQIVCLGNTTVRKAPKPTISLYFRLCLWYTNTRWERYYSNVSDIVVPLHLSNGGAFVEFPRKVHTPSAVPDREWNARHLSILNAALASHFHVCADLKRGDNVFLQPNGRIVLVDFTLYPSLVVKPYLQRGLDQRSKPFPGYSQLFGDRRVVEEWA